MSESNVEQEQEESLSSSVLEYASRDGVKRNTEEAAQFLLNAARQGDAEVSEEIQSQLKRKFGNLFKRKS